VNAKTAILGSGSCACDLATELLAGGAQIIMVTYQGRAKVLLPDGLDIEDGTVEVLTHTQCLACRGTAGNFELLLSTEGKAYTRSVGNIILADSADARPNFGLYGLKPSAAVASLAAVMEYLETGIGLEHRLDGVQKTVFLTGLVGESNPVTAQAVMRTSLRLQQEFGQQTYILTGNLKVAGNGLEGLYHETKQAGTVYVKFSESRPEIDQDKNGRVTLIFLDEITRAKFRLTPDLLVVDETIVPSGFASDLAGKVALDTDTDGFLQTDNVHRATVLTNRKGILVAGSLRSIQSDQDQKTDAANAALAVSKPQNEPETTLQDKAEIDSSGCVKCLTCYRICPYRAIVLNKRVCVAPQACEGCGLCVAECPRGAIRIENLNNQVLFDRIADNRKTSQTDTFSPFIVAFCCSRSAAGAGELAACMGCALPARLKVITVPCAGSVTLNHILRAFSSGADGVLVLTCHEGNCHSQRGNTYAANRVEHLLDLLEDTGFEKERLSIHPLASNMGIEFSDIVNRFEKIISAPGPSGLDAQNGK